MVTNYSFISCIFKRKDTLYSFMNKSDKMLGDKDAFANIAVKSLEIEEILYRYSWTKGNWI